MSTATCIRLSVAGIGLMGALLAGNAVDARTPLTCNGCWAVIEPTAAAANIIRDYGLATAQRVSAGEYRLNFNSRVLNCAAVASIASTAASTNRGEVSTQDFPAIPNTLVVFTFDSSGTQADRPFSLFVNCLAP
jgi:hypothetical protein